MGQKMQKSSALGILWLSQRVNLRFRKMDFWLWAKIFEQMRLVKIFGGCLQVCWLIFFLNWSIVDVQCCVSFCCIILWINHIKKKSMYESKQKQHPVVDGTGDKSKVRCCKKQYCIGTWNIRSMNQGKLEMANRRMWVIFSYYV